jgi:hypothetical protein
LSRSSHGEAGTIGGPSSSWRWLSSRWPAEPWWIRSGSKAGRCRSTPQGRTTRSQPASTAGRTPRQIPSSSSSCGTVALVC